MFAVTVRGDGDIRGGPCSRRVGSGDSLSSALIVRVSPTQIRLQNDGITEKQLAFILSISLGPGGTV